MALVGTLCFCTDCGDLLLRAALSEKEIICHTCGTTNINKWPRQITSTSKPSAFPSKLQQKLRGDIQDISHVAIKEGKAIEFPCEKCGAQELRYVEFQLRSADEGTTLLYHCQKCGHRFQQEN